jgi:hypothetical protein
MTTFCEQIAGDLLPATTLEEWSDTWLPRASRFRPPLQRRTLAPCT